MFWEPVIVKACESILKNLSEAAVATTESSALSLTTDCYSVLDEIIGAFRLSGDQSQRKTGELVPTSRRAMREGLKRFGSKSSPVGSHNLLDATASSSTENVSSDINSTTLKAAQKEELTRLSKILESAELSKETEQTETNLKAHILQLKEIIQTQHKTLVSRLKENSELLTANECLRGKLSAKSRDLAYLRSTLFKENCLLREQLFQANSCNGPDPIQVVSMLDLALFQEADGNAISDKQSVSQNSKNTSIWVGSQLMRAELMGSEDARKRLQVTLSQTEHTKRMVKRIISVQLAAVKTEFQRLKDEVQGYMILFQGKFNDLLRVIGYTTNHPLAAHSNATPDREGATNSAQRYGILTDCIKIVSGFVAQTTKPDSLAASSKEHPSPVLYQTCLEKYGLNAVSPMTIELSTLQTIIDDIRSWSSLMIALTSKPHNAAARSPQFRPRRGSRQPSHASPTLGSPSSLGQPHRTTKSAAAITASSAMSDGRGSPQLNASSSLANVQPSFSLSQHETASSLPSKPKPRSLSPLATSAELEGFVDDYVALHTPPRTQALLSSSFHLDATGFASDTPLTPSSTSHMISTSEDCSPQLEPEDSLSAVPSPKIAASSRNKPSPRSVATSNAQTSPMKGPKTKTVSVESPKHASKKPAKPVAEVTRRASAEATAGAVPKAIKAKPANNPHPHSSSSSSSISAPVTGAIDDPANSSAIRNSPKMHLPRPPPGMSTEIEGSSPKHASSERVPPRRESKAVVTPNRKLQLSEAMVVCDGKTLATSKPLSPQLQRVPSPRLVNMELDVDSNEKMNESRGISWLRDESALLGSSDAVLMIRPVPPAIGGSGHFSSQIFTAEDLRDVCVTDPLQPSPLSSSTAALHSSSMQSQDKDSPTQDQHRTELPPLRTSVGTSPRRPSLLRHHSMTEPQPPLTAMVRQVERGHFSALIRRHPPPPHPPPQGSASFSHSHSVSLTEATERL